METILKKAFLYNKGDNLQVNCYLCNHFCKITEGKFGVCGVRQNIKGVLYAHSYEKVIAMNVDPIEKKPIFHLLPGSKSFSIACAGCNFKCSFCQNWEISQIKGVSDTRKISPAYIIEQVKNNNCKSISYTYTEPTIFFEYAYDIAKLAKNDGLFNVFVTNGYMTKDAIKMISPYLDAANVDLKFFNDENYRRVCGGKLEPVLETIRLMRKLNIWVEVTTLIVPGQNDSNDELKKIAKFLAGIGKEIPWHISRFHPDYKMTDVDVTPVEKLKEAYGIGKEAGLRYVYIGNVIEEEKTHCYNCDKNLIARFGFKILENNLENSRCPKCGVKIDGIF